MFEVVSYSPDCADRWNRFVAESKNATFLFDRGYMGYHADRFRDASLMLLERGKVFAVLPANRVDDVICSHQGLSYGGLLIGTQATAAKVCEAFDAINQHLRQQGIRRVVYKPLPAVYCALPAEEPLYALHHVCHARLVSRDVASVIRLDRQIGFSELRRRGAKKAMRHGVRIAQSDDFPTFWQILEDNLQQKYNSRPVHSLDEMLLLKSRFPDNISLWAAFEDDVMVGGTVIYETSLVAKTQYISASPRGKEIGALDLLFKELIDSRVGQQDYFDMGTSALDKSNDLRLPLIFQKEGFGGRAVCYDVYEWNV